MNYIIFCYPRTGSTLLALALNKHPQLNCAMEVFSEQNTTNWNTSKEMLYWREVTIYNLLHKSVRDLSCTRFSRGQTVKFLDTLNYDLRQFTRELFERFNGFKLIASSVDLGSTAWEVLMDKDIRYIFLERDIFDAYASFKLAENSKSWHVIDNSIIEEPIKVEMENFDWFCDEYIVPYVHIKKLVRRNGIKNIVLNYEELANGWYSSLDRVWSFLGVPKIAIDKPLVKKSKFPHSRNILNYYELTSQRRYRYPALVSYKNL